MNPLESAGGFRFLWTGDLPAGSIATAYDPAAVPRLPAEQRAALERMLARRAELGQVLERDAEGRLPALYRLLSFRGTESGLALELGRTDYAEYLLTNVEHPEWRAELGAGVMSDALAATLVLVTADGLVPWGRRSRRILDARAPFHILPSGHPEPPATLVDGLLAEVREEAGLAPDELSELACTGLLRASVSGKPELTFRARTSATFAAILERERAGAWEFDALYPLVWDPDEALAWIVRHADDAAPPATAALLLAGRAAFGDAWHGEVLRALAVRSGR